MGLKLFDAVVHSDLPKRLRPLALVYARKADDATGLKCYPGMKYTTRALGIRPGMIRRLRAELIALGVLGTETVTRGQRSWPKVVSFHAERLPVGGYSSTDPDRGVAIPVATGPARVGTAVATGRYSSSDRVGTAVAHTSNKSTSPLSTSPSRSTSLPRSTSSKGLSAKRRRSAHFVAMDFVVIGDDAVEPAAIVEALRRSQRDDEEES